MHFIPGCSVPVCLSAGSLLRATSPVSHSVDPADADAAAQQSPARHSGTKHQAGLWCEGLIGQKHVAMELHLLVTVCLLFGKIVITHQTHMSSVYTYLFTPRGPQMFTCLTYLERNVRVDCEFLASDMVPGPYCEYRQDSRLVGSTYPNAVIYVSTEDRRRSNVSLVAPNLCRLTWAPLADEKPYTYTCRVYQGNGWKENSMAVHHRHLLICSAISVLFKSAPWVWSLVISLPVAVGLLSP